MTTPWPPVCICGEGGGGGRCLVTKSFAPFGIKGFLFVLAPTAIVSACHLFPQECCPFQTCVILIWKDLEPSSPAPLICKVWRMDLTLSKVQKSDVVSMLSFTFLKGSSSRDIFLFLTDFDEPFDFQSRMREPINLQDDDGVAPEVTSPIPGFPPRIGSVLPCHCLASLLGRSSPGGGGIPSGPLTFAQRQETFF